MSFTSAKLALRRLPILIAALCMLGACTMGTPPEEVLQAGPSTLNPARAEMALLEAKQKQSKGQRVWCVPFARTFSGVDISGNAKTWWGNAAGQYERGKTPEVGAVMAFAGAKKMPMGHVAVVSQVVSPREIKINHANWVRSKVQLNMKVIDVSAKNDWSSVKVERVAGEMGTSPYPVNGFIYPN